MWTSRDKKPLKPLSELRQKLQDATKLSDVFNFFFDHYGEHEEFLKRGEVSDLSRSPGLLETITGVMKQISPTATIKSSLYVVKHLPEEAFFHGSGAVNDCQWVLLYFEDEKIGMLSVALPGPKAKFVRFKVVGDFENQEMVQRN